MESLTSGTLAGTGSFRCEQCGYVVTLAAADAASALPGLRRQRLHARLPVRRPRFTRELRAERDPARRPPRLAEARAEITEPGQYLAFEDGAGVRASSRSPASGRGSAAASPPTSASTTRRSRAATRSSCARPTASACSTTAASTACSSTASASSGARWRTATRSSSAATGCTSSTCAVRRRRRRATAHRPRRGREAEGRRSRRAARIVRARDGGQTIAVLSQKGGTGKTTTVRTLADVFRRVGLRRARRRPRPAGQPLGLLRRPDPDAIADDRRRAARAARRPPRRSTTAIIPANLGLAEAELVLAGKMGRELTLRRALRERRATTTTCPDRLPAGARPADRQRARRRRLRAAERRGAVLRAAGRRAGARGHRARAREPQPGPRAGSASCSTSPTCAPCTRARRYASLQGALRRQAVRHDDPPVDRLRRVGRARRSRSSTTGPISARTTWRWPTSCSTASGRT